MEVLDGDWQKILVNPALSDAESALEDIKATRDAIVAQAPTLDELSVETDMTTDDGTADEATLMIKTLKKDLAVARMRYEGRMAQFVDRAEESMMGFYDTYTVILTSLKELQTLEADANMRAMKKLLARADEMDRRVTAIEDRVPVSSQ